MAPDAPEILRQVNGDRMPVSGQPHEMFQKFLHTFIQIDPILIFQVSPIENNQFTGDALGPLAHSRDLSYLPEPRTALLHLAGGKLGRAANDGHQVVELMDNP